MGLMRSALFTHPTRPIGLCSQATVHNCTRNGYLRQGAWLQGEIRALFTNLSIWLRLHPLKGTFGTWHAATFPASFLMLCPVSALMPRFLAVAGAHPASWSCSVCPIQSFFKVQFSSLFSVSLNSTWHHMPLPAELATVVALHLCG